MAINLILILTVVNGIAVQAARLVLPLYALKLGASALTIGALGASFAVLPLLLSVPAGRIADRFGSRGLLIFSALAAGVSMLVPYFQAGVTSIFVAAMIMGLAFGIYNVSMQTLIGLLSTADNRTRNFSNWSLANAATNFIAPLVAGFSVERAGHANSCLYLALVTVIPVGILVFRGGAFSGGMREEASATSESISLLAQPGIKRTLAASSLLLTGVDLYRIYLPVYGHAIGLTPLIIGIVLSAFAVAAFVVRLVMQPLINRFKEEKVLAVCFYVAALCLASIPLVHSGTALAIISFVFGLGMGCGQPIITMVMYNTSPKGRAGEAMGLRMTVVHLTRLVGPVLFGSIASALGLLGMYWVNAVMMGAGGWLSHPAKKMADKS